LQVFVAHKTASGIKAATLRTYRTFKKRLGGFAAQRGYQMIDEVTPTDIDVFWAGWEARAACEWQPPHHPAQLLPFLPPSQMDRRIARQPRC
jgi:hypothetical protein